MVYTYRRGTFTNLIANEAQNPYEIAHLRGDSSLESALFIWSQHHECTKIEEKLDNMHEEYIPKLIERKLKGIIQLDKDYYSIKEASEILGRSMATIQNSLYSKQSNHKMNVKINGRVLYQKKS